MGINDHGVGEPRFHDNQDMKTAFDQLPCRWRGVESFFESWFITSMKDSDCFTMFLLGLVDSK